MRYYEVVPTRIFRADSDILTYTSEQALEPGFIVTVPLGKLTVVAVIWNAVKKPDFPTKPITRIIYDTPLPPHLLTSAKWLSEYYLCPLPEVIRAILPAGVEKKRRQK